MFNVDFQRTIYLKNMCSLRKFHNLELTIVQLLVTIRDTLLMETGLLHDYFGNFSMRGEKDYFHVEENMKGEIESM